MGKLIKIIYHHQDTEGPYQLNLNQQNKIQCKKSKA